MRQQEAADCDASGSWRLLMAENSDSLKGRAKEAAGALTDNDDLRHEGKTDQKVGKLKQGVRDAASKVEEGIDAARNKTRKQK
jgi:uncharacterized protein YjbJ (UPF0337 family)